MPGWAAGRRGRRRVGCRQGRARCRGSRRRRGWRRRHSPLAEQGRRRTRRGRIGNRCRRVGVLRVGPVGDQRIGDIGERRAIRLRRLGRHRCQVRIGLVRTGRRRSLFGDLAALQIVPPGHRVHRRRKRGTARQQQTEHRRSRRCDMQTQARRARYRAAISLNPVSCTPRLPATFADQHSRIRSRPRRLGVACGGADGKDAYGRDREARNRRVQAARPGGDRSFDGRRRRTLPAHRRRMAEAPGERGARARSVQHRQRLHGDDREADGQPSRRDGGPARLLAGLHDALAEHRAAHHGHGCRHGDRLVLDRPTLQGRCVEGERGLRLHQAVLPAVRALRAGRGQAGRRPGCEDGAEGGFLFAAVRRCDEPVELPADQSRGAPQDRRDRRREPAEGPEQPAERSRAAARASCTSR